MSRVVRTAMILGVLALAFPANVIYSYYAEYSPGPWATSDLHGNDFNSQHNINYDWNGSAGIYVRSQKLRIDVTDPGDEVDCGWAMINETWTHEYYSGVGDPYTPFPLDYYDSTYWWTVSWQEDYDWQSVSDIIEFVQETGGDIGTNNCNGDITTDLGGWQSVITDDHNWGHQFDSY